ncbi:MAG: cell division protein FtsQ/DivIB [Acidimicrobiales bacterium]
MTDPRIHERRVLVAREKGRLRRRFVLGGLLVVVIGAAGFAFVHSSMLGARHVEVTGATHTSVPAIVKVAGLKGAPPLVDLSSGHIARRVETLPWVKKVAVSFAWPSTVRIELTERVPVARVRAGSAGWAVTDRTGRVLEDVLSPPPGLPQLGGSLKVPLPGHQLPGHWPSLARVAAFMPQALVAKIVDLRWGRAGALVELSSRVTAVIGSTAMLAEKFVALATVLAHGHLAGIGTIDLRVPSAPVLIHSPASPIVARNVGG